MFLPTRRILALSCGLALGLSAISAANANDATINSTVEVLNVITIAEVAPLDFGLIGITPVAAESATLTLDATTSALSVGGDGWIAMLGGHAIAEMSVAADAGAANQTINMEILSAGVVDLTDGTDSFALSAFTYDDNITNAGAAALDTAVPVELDGTGATSVNFGATITADGNNTYADGVYNGSFDVTVYY